MEIKRLKFIKYETKEVSEIHEDYYNKLLEYISKTGEILKQYYFSDDAQKKAALFHQYCVLTGTSKNAKNSTWCTNCENEKTLFQSEGCCF